MLVSASVALHEVNTMSLDTLAVPDANAKRLDLQYKLYCTSPEISTTCAVHVRLSVTELCARRA